MSTSLRMPLSTKKKLKRAARKAKTNPNAFAVAAIEAQATLYLEGEPLAKTG